MFHHLCDTISWFPVERIPDVAIVTKLYDQGLVSIATIHTYIPCISKVEPLLRWFPGDPKPSRALANEVISRRTMLQHPREVHVVEATTKLRMRSGRWHRYKESSRKDIDEQYLIGRVFLSLSGKEQDLWRNITHRALSEVSNAIVHRTVLSIQKCRKPEDVQSLYDLCKEYDRPFRIY